MAKIENQQFRRLELEFGGRLPSGQREYALEISEDVGSGCARVTTRGPKGAVSLLMGKDAVIAAQKFLGEVAESG